MPLLIFVRNTVIVEHNRYLQGLILTHDKYLPIFLKLKINQSQVQFINSGHKKNSGIL